MPLADVVLAILDGDRSAMRDSFVRLVSLASGDRMLTPQVRDALLHELCWALLTDDQEMPVVACEDMQLMIGSSFAAGAAKLLSHCSPRALYAADVKDRPRYLM